MGMLKKRLIVLLFLVMLTGAAALRLPLFAVSAVLVEGTQALSPDAVGLLAGIRPGDNIFRFDAREAAEGVLDHPLVQGVTVQKILPDRIKIVVKERVPIALVPHFNAYLAVDASAVALMVVNDLSVLRLPLITGIDTTEARLGEAVESKALLVGVDCLRALDRAWLEQISEVHIDKNLVITAYTMDKSVITLGIADNQVAAKMEALQAMLRDLYSRGERGQRINLTQLNRPVIQR